MSQKKPTKKIKPPKGTRDLYPEEVLRQRYITNAWRDAALRCGFDEIAGPTFETTDLYSVKSGEGILNELFQAFSGKSEKEIEQVKATGQAEYALRPEFTPTLARMYAAKAKELPKPCKWFTAGPYFRAERPQRGRLREFLQWNVDAIGLPGEETTPESKARIDLEVIACCSHLFEALGFNGDEITIMLNSRKLTESTLALYGVREDHFSLWFNLLDKIEKISFYDYMHLAAELGETPPTARRIRRAIDRRKTTLKKVAAGIPDAFEWSKRRNDTWISIMETIEKRLKNEMMPEEEAAHLRKMIGEIGQKIKQALGRHEQSTTYFMEAFAFGAELEKLLDQQKLHSPPVWDESIVRGLAYYTGTVFEAIADGERAVAGGGRYDNLIELFGGPPTPACGFGMGDVVLGNLLEDKGLMPTGSELMDAVARPQASIRPVAFVVPNGDDENEGLVHELTANLRRGIECTEWQSRNDRKPWDRDRYRVPPMHARISYKSTRNMKKLRSDAEKQHARFFVEIHADNKVELTNMDTREPITSNTHGSFSIDPAAENYVGTAIAARP